MFIPSLSLSFYVLRDRCPQHLYRLSTPHRFLPEMMRLPLPIDTMQGQRFLLPAPIFYRNPIHRTKYSLFINQADIYNQQVVFCSRSATFKITNFQTFGCSGSVHDVFGNSFSPVIADRRNAPTMEPGERPIPSARWRRLWWSRTVRTSTPRRQRS